MGRTAWSWQRAMVLMAVAALIATVPGLGMSAQAASGDTVEIAVLLQEPATYVVNTDGSCAAAAGYTPLMYGAQEFPLTDGVAVTAKDSPTGQPGCLVTVVAERDPFPSVLVEVGKVGIGQVTPWDLGSLDYRLELVVTEGMEEQANVSWRFSGDTSWQVAGKGTPVPTAVAVGESVNVVLFAEEYFGEEEQDGSCSLYVDDFQFGSQSFVLEHGVVKTEADSPTGMPGCEFVMTAALDNRDWYPIILNHHALGWVTQEELATLNYRVEILMNESSFVVGREGGWRFASGATPVAWAGGAKPESGTTLLAGSLVLGSKEGRDYSIADGGCAGQGVYTEIHVGTRVTIRDEAGKAVGEALLEPSPGAAFGYCVFRFYALVPVLPFYTVSIPGWDGAEYTWAQLNDKGWFVDIAIGATPPA